MALSAETLALMAKLGIRLAGPDDPIYREGSTITLRTTVRSLTRDEAMDQSCERILAEAKAAMRAYCGLPPEEQ